MKFGYQQPSNSFPKNIFLRLSGVAREAEELGFDSFWIMDHLTQIELVGNEGEPIMEAYTTLGALSATTRSIKLGALCTCNFFRNPALLSKMGATIDQISEGRFWLGIGAGWFRGEATRYGFRFEEDKTRLEMLDEALQIIKKAWTEERPSFWGKHYTIEEFILEPRPVQKPHPPVLVGGEGEKMTLKLVAKYGDACNLFSKGEELRRKLRILKAHCRSVGRDYSKILKTKLASVMFGRSEEDALLKMKKFKPQHLDLDSYSSSFVFGTASQINEQIDELQELGIEYLIINSRGRYDQTLLRKFARDIMSSF